MQYFHAILIGEKSCKLFVRKTHTIAIHKNNQLSLIKKMKLINYQHRELIIKFGQVIPRTSVFFFPLHQKLKRPIGK